MSKLKQIWVNDETARKLKSDASALGKQLKDYVDDMAKDYVPRKKTKKMFRSFP